MGKVRQVNVAYDGSGRVTLPTQVARYKLKAIVFSLTTSPATGINVRCTFQYGGVASGFVAYTPDIPNAITAQFCFSEVGDSIGLGPAVGPFNQVFTVPLPRDFILDSQWEVFIDMFNFDGLEIVPETSFVLEDIE